MAWTIVESVHMDRVGPDRLKKKTVKLACTSDGSSTSHTLSTGGLKGLHLYAVKYVPDGTDTPTSLATVTIEDENGVPLFDEAVTAVDAAEHIKGDIDAGIFPLIDGSVVFKSTTLANTKKADFYLQFQE